MADVSTRGRSRNSRVAILVVLVGLVAGAGGAAIAVAVTGRDGPRDDERATEVRGATVGSTTTTTEAPSFSALVAEVRTGVARIEATTCGDGAGTGTGFLVDPTHVLTVAHVVDDAATIAITFDDDDDDADDDRVLAARVVGFDAVKEIALLELEAPVDGHLFDLAVEPVRIGTEVAALGYPQDLALTFTKGTVSGLGRTIDFESATVEGLIQTDTALNPGNSGGPLMTIDGRVRGLVEAGLRDSEGISFAVASDVAIPLLRRWTATPDVRQPADCDRPRYAGGDVEVDIEDDAPEAVGIAQTLTRYFQAINDGEYDEAWAQYSPRLKDRVPRERFAEGVRSSFDLGITLHSVIVTGDGTATAHVTFTSVQRPEQGPRPGEECTDWSLDYRMLRTGGRWTIDGSDAHAGGEKSTSCAGDDV